MLPKGNHPAGSRWPIKYASSGGLTVPAVADDGGPDLGSAGERGNVAIVGGYGSSFLGGTVSEVDMVIETVLHTFFIGGTPQDMAVNRNGSRLYVANEQGYLNEIDLFTGDQLPAIPLASGGFGVGVTPDDGEAYDSGPSAGLVQVLSLADQEALEDNRCGWRAAPAGLQPAR